MFLSAALPLLQQLFAHSPWIQTGGRVKKIEKLIFCSVFQHILYSKYYWKLCNKSTCRRYALHTLAKRTQRKRILFTFFRSVRIEKYFWFLWQPPFCICMCADIHTHTHKRVDVVLFVSACPVLLLPLLLLLKMEEQLS